MKIRSLLLGSAVAAGLSSGAFAADLGVLTSLDVCDALGISGLTISSSSNCLSIAGGVSYEFAWGDFRANTAAYNSPFGTLNLITPDSEEVGSDEDIYALDWDSKVEAWVRLTAASASDFGTAKAIVTFRQVEHVRFRNGGYTDGDGNFDSTPGYVLGGDNFPLAMDEAYVSIGDTTVIMAGLRRHGHWGSIGNFDDDAAYGWLQTFNSSQVTGSGVSFEGSKDDPRFGGASIQIVSDLGNGFSVGAALENIDSIYTPIGTSTIPAASGTTWHGGTRNQANWAGTALGVINYRGDGVTAHLTGGAFGVLDGHVDGWFAHAGASAKFDNFRLRGAFGYEHDVASGYYLANALASAEATFDIFTLAVAVDGVFSDAPAHDEAHYGFVVSGGFKVTDTVSLNLAGRWAHNENLATSSQDSMHIAAQLVASVTESIKLTGEVGGYFRDSFGSADPVYYGSLEAAWNPGGGYTASIKGEVNSLEAYRATFKAAKSFQ